MKLARQEQLWLLEILPRFGVEQPLCDGHPTATYWAWYHWWKDWYGYLSDDDFRLLDSVLDMDMSPEQIAEYRPAGDWRQTPTQPS